jgi:excisionase family DNA binding protein
MRLLTAEQVAEKLQVHVKWVYRNREIPRVELGGHVRWDEAQVDAWIQLKTTRKAREVMRHSFPRAAKTGTSKES